MSRRALLVVAIVGLLLAIAGSLAYLQYWSPTRVTCVPAALLAVVVLFGRRRTRWFWAVPILLLIGLATISAVAAFGIWWHIVPYLGPLNVGQLTPVIDFGSGADQMAIVFSVIAFVLYLIAATLYGFAGQAQGVKVGARTGLLVLLLLSIIPILNILGLIGFLITAIKRQPV